MENNEIKELIIQKQEKYDEITDNKKKKSIKTGILTAIFAVMYVASIFQLDPVKSDLHNWNFIITNIIGFLGLTISLENLVLALSQKSNAEIRKSELDELLKEINGEEKGKTL